VPSLRIYETRPVIEKVRGSDTRSSLSVVDQFESKLALSVLKNTGRRGLYKTMSLLRGFVAAARFWAGSFWFCLLG
jgi:hypothetical protein